VGADTCQNQLSPSKEKRLQLATIHSQPEVGVMRRYPYGAVATLCVGLFLLAAVCAPESTGRPQVGVPQDWSQRQILFTRAGLLQHPNLLDQEPRVLHQAMQRWQAPIAGISHRVDTALTPLVGANQRDWSVNIRGRLSPNMFPAKFGFDAAAAPSCANDYVVFGTTATGVTGGASNLVAFNNLYSGPGGLCGAAPTVLFAYNISTVAGHIETSPVLSLDGKKIAFVESVTGSATFHVLTWVPEGAIAAAADGALRMTSLTYSPASNNNTVSPWVDYRDDVAYVGSDDTKIYKITGVFNGTPAVAAGWPVTLGTNVHLTPPVLDRSRSLLMVGGANGVLYQINTNTGVVRSITIGAGPNHGIVAPPSVDVTNGTTFVVSSDDSAGATGTGVLVEVDTQNLTLLAKGRIGVAGHSGTAISLYQPAFSDSYYNDPSTGVVRLCGTGAADISPWQYAFGFVGRTMQPTPVFSQQLVTSTAARCTPWTEFFNPNIGAGGTDFFFFGLTQDCTAPGTGFTDGCVVARTNDSPVLTKAKLNGGPSGIIVDNFANPITSGQASSLYMMAGRVNTAYKFTQNGLQ
jgi:hypothetical protein